MYKNQKHILLLTTHFPPINVSGVHRIIGFLRYLSKEKYKLTVLTIEHIPEAPIDKDLLKFVPNHIEIIKTNLPQLNIFSKNFIKKSPQNIRLNTKCAPKIDLKSKIRKYIKKIIFFPDRFWPWFFTLIPNIIKKISKPDCIIATAPPFSTLLIGLILSKYWKSPLISDFRDPWSLNPFIKDHSISKNLHQKLENFIIKFSKFIIMNTEEALEAYKKKYKKYTNKILYIPNGFDNYNLYNNLNNVYNKKDKIYITHCGNLYGFRNPLPLLEALSKYFIDSPFFFSFYGYINNDFLNYFDMNKNLKNIIKIHKTVSYIQSLKIMYSSDIILVFGNCNDKSLQIPRKIYDILNINRPIFLIDVKNSPSYNLLKKLEIPFFFSENTCSNIISTLNFILKIKKNENFKKYSYRPSTINRFHVKNLTAKLEELLDNL